MPERNSELLTIVPLLSTPYMLIKKTAKDQFHGAYHHHPEIQLEYVLAGSGVQIIGDQYSRFQAGDLVLFGPGLPHLRKPDQIYWKEDFKEEFEVITLIFSLELFSPTMLSIPAFKNIQRLIQNSKRGVIINGETKEKAIQLLDLSFSAKPVRQISLLLDILYEVGNSSFLEYILPEAMDSLPNENHSNRISNIYAYALENFRDKITIKEIAKVANLSEHSFCRYFKQTFKKHFSHFLAELRINYASNLLNETERSISEICFESGFNNFANFNKWFRRIKNCTPSDYRRKYQILVLDND